MPLESWAAKLNTCALKGKKVALALMTFKASIRPNAMDKSNMMILKSVIKEVQPANLAYVITFVDEAPKTYTMDKIKKFFDALFEHLPEFTVPDEKNIFLFHGKGETPTTHEEYEQWVKSLLPEAEKTSAKITD